jgi:hypothetical protein
MNFEIPLFKFCILEIVQLSVPFFTCHAFFLYLKVWSIKKNHQTFAVKVVVIQAQIM